MQSPKTHCVTFTFQGTKYYAIKSRGLGDPVPTGISHPEIKCAFSESDAAKLARICIEAKFANVKIHQLNIKRKTK